MGGVGVASVVEGGLVEKGYLLRRRWRRSNRRPKLSREGERGKEGRREGGDRG
jgi:hypothetical protein